MQELADQFHALFAGLQRAYGTYKTSGETSAKGKAKGRGTTVKGELTTALWQAHLEGKQRLGVVPITDEATASFGAIDVDVYDLDIPALEHRVAQLGLPLITCRSKSGGAHLYLFTDEAPAELVVKKLTEWAVALGHPGVEVFPKQTKLASGNDVGNWINMPYFDAELTSTYALYQGKAVSASDFIARATSMKLDEEALTEVTIQGVDLPEGTPPCLRAIALNGAPEGTRNNALFAFGVLAKQLAEQDGGDAASTLHEFNDKFMDPPLPFGEVQGMAASVDKKEYFYPCDTAPLSSYCDKRACKRAAFGVGGGDGFDDPGVMIDRVTKLLTDPPTWIFCIGGINVEMDTDDFLSQTRFKRKVAEKLNKIPRSLKQHKWEEMMNSHLANAEEEEAPEDASSRGQFMTHLHDFCLKQSRGTTEESLATNGIYHNEEEGRVYFRSTYLEKYLGQQKFFDLSGRGLWTALRKLDGVNHGQFNIKGRNIQWWSIPVATVELEDFSVPQVAEEEF